jgi:transposase/uncharacterized protein YnzC (UPF0291/DUF896 family)
VPGIAALGVAAKKKSLHDSQRETPRVKRLRRKFGKRIEQELGEVVQHLKFIDEMGAHLGLTRLYGRAAPGERVVEATPGYSGQHYTILATLGWDSVTAPWVLEGPMDTIAFETYVAHVLAPTLQLGDIVMLDNLSAHKAERITRLVEARGARLEFLPPYSSDFNPIELCWSKVKTALRTAKARTLDALLTALMEALESVSVQDIHAWFKHCGYVLS